MLSRHRRLSLLFGLTASALSLLSNAQDAKQGTSQDARQETKPAPVSTLSVQAKLVVVPATVSDKHGLVTDLTKESFALSVDGKPQTVRYFDHDTDVPLTVGLLVDVSGNMTDNLDEEQKASRAFLESFLAPASGTRPADRAFVMQFARTAELLQDVTDSRPLLAAGLKEIGTESPGTADDDTQTGTNNGNNGNGNSGNGNNGGNNGGGNNGGGNNGGNSGSNNGGYGRGGYGGRGGSNNGGGNNSGSSGDRPRGGTVLYDALFLSANDVQAKQTGRRALIVLTDGEDRHSKESLTEAIESVQRADTVVYGIYYKGQEHHDFNPGGGSRRGGYGGYPGGGYPGGGNYPGSGGRPGSDGTYARVDGKKILERICGETGGRVFEVKGKGSMEAIYKQIGDELRAQYRLGFTPDAEAAGIGYHHIQLSLATPSAKKDDIQTRDGYYTGQPPGQ